MASGGLPRTRRRPRPRRRGRQALKRRQYDTNNKDSGSTFGIQADTLSKLVKVGLKVADALGIDARYLHRNSKHIRRATNALGTGRALLNGRAPPHRRKSRPMRPRKDRRVGPGAFAHAYSALERTRRRDKREEKTEGSEKSKGGRGRGAGRDTTAKQALRVEGEALVPIYTWDASSTRPAKSILWYPLTPREKGSIRGLLSDCAQSILECSNAELARYRDEYRLIYVGAAVLTIKCAVMGLIEECPGHFVLFDGKHQAGQRDFEEEGDRWRAPEEDWLPERRGRPKHPLFWVEDLLHDQYKANRAAMKGSLNAYKVFFGLGGTETPVDPKLAVPKGAEYTQLMYVKHPRDQGWYVEFPEVLFQAMERTRPIVEYLIDMYHGADGRRRDYKKLSAAAKGMFDRYSRDLWRTWTWAHKIVTEHWQHVVVKSGRVTYDRVQEGILQRAREGKR